MPIPFPEDFLNSMGEMLGDEFPAFLRALEAPPALALRLNPKRAGAEAAAAPYAEGRVPWAEWGRYLRSGAELKPGSSIAHAAGAFYLQEASAMAAAAALDARPGERILDLCAAPGGKSTQIAAAMADAGLLVSNDPEPARARALAGNLERMGAANSMVVCALPQKLAKLWPGRFDALLVDAPCSGEGMFRRDPQSRSEWKSGAPAGCARRQAEILDCAAALVRPGGRLVYSTCTFNAEENEGSVSGFLARHPEFAPEDFALEGVGASSGGMLRLFPHRLRGDGHFVARLRKAGDAPGRIAPTPRPDRAALAALTSLKREIGDPAGFVPEGRIALQGDCLVCLPEGAPPTEGLRVISPGLRLARLGRSHVEPDHALAMALPPELLRAGEAMDDDRAAAWLRGEALESEGGKGWTPVTWRGMPLGWGKRSGGALKNHLPKGLRRMK